MAKSTFEIPGPLYISVKKKAADEGEPIRIIVEKALRNYLSSYSSRTSKKPKKVKWVTVGGKLPSQLDLGNREKMFSWIKE